MRTIALILLTCGALAACNPTFNWREYASPDAPYHALFPDKPASYTRGINLDGLAVDMTMTAAEVEGTVFAVGSAQAPDAARAQAALEAMKAALVRNIGATVTSEKRTAGRAIDIEANGLRNGQPIRLTGHFEARDKRIYQVIVMGPPGAAGPEQIEQFLGGFKLQ